MPACPICKAEAKALDRTGYHEGVDCPKHGPFKVSGSVLVDSRTKDAEPTQWETALAKAKKRANEGEWPVIVTYDFGV
jgi:hypothetical protein